MADQNPSEKKSTEAIPGQPVGEKKQTKAIPGKPVEGAELRKETVRINLPPKLGEQAQPGPAPTVRLPGPGATGQPATVKLTPPTGQTTVMRAAPVAPAGPKKSDTAQVLTTVLPAPTVPVGEAKPTVKLKAAGQTGTQTAVTAAMPPTSTGSMSAATMSMPPATMQDMAPPEPQGLETALCCAAAVLSIALAVLLFLAR